MANRIFSLCTLIAILSATLFSCVTASLPNLSNDDCEQLASVADSCTFDTLGILGTIYPQRAVFQGDSANRVPYSTWTPTKHEVILAEKIFRRHLNNKFRCIDSGYARYYRQYAGRGVYNNCILIRGMRMSKPSSLCGYRSFWINVYDSGCSVFNAMVDIRLGTCVIELEERIQ